MIDHSYSMNNFFINNTMKNTTAEHICNFLKVFPPFSMLSVEQLHAISKAVTMYYLKEGIDLFMAGNPIKNEFYVVKEGAIGLFQEQTHTWVDKCDEGDIFGLRALIRQDNYKLTARTLEETVLYSISLDIFENYIAVNPEASTFLMSSFIVNTNSKISEFVSPAEPIQDFFQEQSVEYSRKPIYCTKEESIKSAAQIMNDNHVGSIIVTENKKPVGIVTDKDLRAKVATGLISIENKVTHIMSFPVITYPENITVAEAQIAMLKHSITHLCITKDGTPNSELIGMLSEHDIVVIREDNPSMLVKEIKEATTPEVLQNIRQRAESVLERYIKQQIPITFVAKILSAINYCITQKLIDLALAEMSAPPPTTFAWLAIGSQGREEQLLLTDQDNALVFNTVQKQEYESTKQYFLELSKKINHGLHIVGFELCPAEMMASNPKWCLSVLEWEAQFKTWITQPDEDNLMLYTIFFDFDYVYGDQNLVKTMTHDVSEAIESQSVFLNFLGLNALKNPPPLSFFRQFLVERNGEHKDQFDIKARAMMPLVDAARVLILSANIKACNNTLERYEKLAALEPQNKDIYLASQDAFKSLLRFRTEQGLLNNDSGRFIDLKSLSKANRLELKSCFKAAKDVQSLIQTRFNLAQLM